MCVFLIFENYFKLISLYLLVNFKYFLIIEKYLGYVNGVLKNRKLNLSYKLLKRLLIFNKGNWFVLKYIKLII